MQDNVMQRNLSSLDSQEFDLVVIGGGIFGACAAWDATQRGLSVALIDRGDFCGSTSANSFKLIHGGIRYLQHGDLYRVRESANARRTMLRIAPHLVHPLPIVVPTYGHGMKGKAVLRLAMAIYDLLTLDRNRGIPDPDWHIPRGKCLSKEEVIRLYPGIETKGLTGAGIFCDGQMYNPPRLVLSFIRTAMENGAVAANYVEATGFVNRNNRICGVEAKDVFTGARLTIRGKTVLNAAGPYAEALLERGLGRRVEPRTPWSRDAYFVVRRPLVPEGQALALPSATRDPEAVMSRGERHLFLVPWRGYTLVGVWHKIYQGGPDEYNVTDLELEGFVNEINRADPSLKISLDEVSLWNAGLIPFGENDPHATDLKFAHRSRLIDHARNQGIEGLVTLIGVRYTTGPCDAVAAVTMIFRKLGRKPVPSLLQKTPLYGGAISNFEGLVQQAMADCPAPLGVEVMRALVHNYGTTYRRVLSCIQARPDLSQTICSSTVLKAQVIHAVREEMAQTLSDVVFRRTDLGAVEHPGDDALRVCAHLMASESEWNENRVCQELTMVNSFFSSRASMKQHSACS